MPLRIAIIDIFAGSLSRRAGQSLTEAPPAPSDKAGVDRIGKTV